MEKLYNDVIIDQLGEMEYAIRDGLVLNKKQQEEILLLCHTIIDFINEDKKPF
jgi:hypothetical protein